MGGRAVLSLGKLAHGQQQYYVDSVARGAEEYYTGAKEAPGQWVGAAAGRLGLEGEIDAEALANLLAHVDPSGAYRLTAAHSVPTVAAFDATFCAPKSVSLLFALGDPEVSNEVRNAADSAIAASLPVLEQAACRVRRGKGGHTVLDGDGFVAAAFRHRTSRAGDPHLHTHVVIANLAHSPADDRWTALDGRPLYSWLSPVGHLYEAHLRWELTRRLGVDWGPVRNGIADVAGIPKPVLREFSTRRREIEAHLDEHGQHSARAAQFATYATRRPKDHDLDAGGLLPGWWSRAEALGLDADALIAVLDRSRSIEPPAPDTPEAEQLYRWLASAEGLTAKASTFGERDVIKAICNALPAGGRVDQILDLVDGFVRSEHVLAVRADRTAAVIHRDDGKVIPARTDELRFTTAEMLALEARLVAGAERRRYAGTAVGADRAVEAALTARPTLSGEQEAMVRTICGSGAGVDIVEGVAGAGKTFALAAARDAWETSGYRVIGCSLAARAAKQLQDDAGIPAATIDRFLAGIERHQAALDDTTVLVIDEAAMVGTRKLARLLDHAEAAGAKVVLVGDPCQLPEIDAGGAFRGLRARLGASDLTENRRQTDAWERNALAELRAGDTDQAVDAYLEHDRVHHAASDNEARELLVEEWMNARCFDDEDALMVAARLADVDDLNRRARQALRAEGYLGADQVVLAGRGYTEGDDVLALRNDYRLDVLNGIRAVVERIDTKQQQMTLGTSDGRRLLIPFAYGEAGHLTHGYATTIHKAQGATIERCLVLLDDTTSREHAYTALSRGRYGNVFVVAEDRRADERHAAEIEPDPLDDLRRAIRHSAGKRMALDDIEQPVPSTLDELRHERAMVQRTLGAGPPDPSWEHRLLSEELAREKNYREGAQWRIDMARQELRDLGPVGRRMHRSQRRELERRIDGFEADIDRHDVRLADLEGLLRKIAPQMLARCDWERAHKPELDRVEALDRQIAWHASVERVLTRELERGLDRGAERSLGIEL
jgi:conjugative relaxase-like TrwC/TraI family protein